MGGTIEFDFKRYMHPATPNNEKYYNNRNFYFYSKPNNRIIIIIIIILLRIIISFLGTNIFKKIEYETKNMVKRPNDNFSLTSSVYFVISYLTVHDY